MALRVFPGRIILLAGGYDKGQDLTGFAEEIGLRVAAVVLMGQTAPALHQLLATKRSDIQIRIATDFRDAFLSAVAFSQQGDIVLLSPGCASYGWFQDFQERGDLFPPLQQGTGARIDDETKHSESRSASHVCCILHRLDAVKRKAVKADCRGTGASCGEE